MFVHTVIMVIEPHMKQGRQHKLISTIFLATSVTKKLDHNSMLFGSDVKKQFFQKRIKGRGYCDVGTSVISEFYTPLVPKGHDFLQTIGSLAQARQDGTATCEAKGDGTD